MPRLVRFAPALVLLYSLQAEDATPADRALLAALQRVSGLPHAVLIRRIQADDASDLVVAIASPRLDGGPLWSTKERLGVLLQDRTDPSRVFSLILEPGPDDNCLAAHIERLTAGEAVISCLGEKWPASDYRKFVFDVRSRKLMSHSSYPPFATALVLPGSRGPRFVMADTQRLLLVDLDAAGSLRVVPDAEASATLSQVPKDYNIVGNQVIRMPMSFQKQPPEFGPGGRFRITRGSDECGAERVDISEGPEPDRKFYPLPRTDIATWMRTRPDDVKNYRSPDVAEWGEVIGPHQLEGDRLWFGKTFYNAEGVTGVGGFGYFDAATASYRLYSPPELYEWSVSAILVEPGSVWLGLYHRGEYGDSPGGLLRWDRETNEVRSFAVQSIIGVIVRKGDVLYLAATDGIVTLRGGRVDSYFVDRSADGSYRTVER